MGTIRHQRRLIILAMMSSFLLAAMVAIWVSFDLIALIYTTSAGSWMAGSSEGRLFVAFDAKSPESAPGFDLATEPNAANLGLQRWSYSIFARDLQTATSTTCGVAFTRMPGKTLAIGIPCLYFVMALMVTLGIVLYKLHKLRKSRARAFCIRLWRDCEY